MKVLHLNAYDIQRGETRVTSRLNQALNKLNVNL
jgi:hypothetical protein